MFKGKTIQTSIGLISIHTLKHNKEMITREFKRLIDSIYTRDLRYYDKFRGYITDMIRDEHIYRMPNRCAYRGTNQKDMKFEDWISKNIIIKKPLKNKIGEIQALKEEMSELGL